MARAWYFTAYPEALPTLDHVALREMPEQPLGEGQIRVRNEYLSVDPYMRGRMYDRPSYAPPFQIGEAMQGGAIGRVELSNNPEFKPGDLVESMNGWREAFVSELGVACGLAFAPDGTVFVGDRTGTVHRVSADGARTEVFATLPASVAAYHLAMGPDDCLYVTGPTLATHDAVYRFDMSGRHEVIDRSFGRPQGLAFDAHGVLHVVEAEGRSFSAPIITGRFDSEAMHAWGVTWGLARGDLVWRPLDIAAVNRMEAGILVAGQRPLSHVAGAFVERLTRRFKQMEIAAAG